MATKTKIPGDILRIMRNVDKQTMRVNISGLVVDMTRRQFDTLMKCIVFEFPGITTEGDAPADGFYLVDTKTKTATLQYEAILKHNTTALEVNGRIFKVNTPWKGYTYS